MWSFYISHIDAIPDTANQIDRADWNICHDIYAGLRSLEKSLIFARFNPDRFSRDSAFRECYENAGVSEQNAFIILSEISRTVAEKRGLVCPRQERLTHPYRPDKKTVQE